MNAHPSKETLNASQSRETVDRPALAGLYDETPRGWPIGTVIVVPVGFLFFIGMVQLMLFIARPTNEVSRLKMSPEQMLQERVVEDQKRLTSYGWVDSKAKTAYIPIERAMELLTEEATKSKVEQQK